MNHTSASLHFFVALSAGLLTGVGGLGLAYILEHAYGLATGQNSPLLMTIAVATIAASLAILNWREDFDSMLDGTAPLLQHTVFRVWAAVFAFWFLVVVAGSVNARYLQGEEWYQQMPGALVFYIVPTFMWLHLTRLIVKARFLKRKSDVRPA